MPYRHNTSKVSIHGEAILLQYTTLKSSALQKDYPFYSYPYDTLHDSHDRFYHVADNKLCFHHHAEPFSSRHVYRPSPQLHHTYCSCYEVSHVYFHTLHQLNRISPTVRQSLVTSRLTT